MTLANLPTLNALINTLVAILLVVAFFLIRRGQTEAHRRVMLTAFGLSCAFLVSYLVYHYGHGSRRFAGEGWLRPFYFALLLSHTVLATLSLPLILMTLSRGLSGKFDKHRKIAKLTWAMWLYVAVTGPVVYILLYHVGSTAHAEEHVPALGDQGTADFRAAQALHKQGEELKALRRYQAAQAKGHVGAECYVAVLQGRHEGTGTSSVSLARSVGQHAFDIHCVTLWGRELIYQNKLRDAEQVLKHAVFIDKRDAFAHASLGFAQFRSFAYEEAAASFEEALTLDPRFAVYAYNAGLAHYLRGAYDPAETLYRNALSLGLNQELAQKANTDLDVIRGALWVCPMHAHITGKENDRCSVCQMALRPVSRHLPDDP